MLTRLTSLFLLCFTSLLNAEMPKFTHTVMPKGESTHYAVVIEKDLFKEIITHLPNPLIELNTRAIEKVFAKRLELGKAELGTAADYPALAKLIVEKEFLPLLNPRVEKFNELITTLAEADSVSAGFVAFEGIASCMTEQSRSLCYVKPYHQYRYNENDFENGSWEGCDDRPHIQSTWRSLGNVLHHRVLGTRAYSAHLRPEIDEKLVLGKGQYGLEDRIEIQVKATGTVQLAAEHKAQYEHFKERNYQGPSIEISLTPFTTIVASKEIKPNNYFQIKSPKGDKKKWTTNSRVNYPSTLTMHLFAEKPAAE